MHPATSALSDVIRGQHGDRGWVGTWMGVAEMGWGGDGHVDDVGTSMIKFIPDGEMMPIGEWLVHGVRGRGRGRQAQAQAGAGVGGSRCDGDRRTCPYSYCRSTRRSRLTERGDQEGNEEKSYPTPTPSSPRGPETDGGASRLGAVLLYRCRLASVRISKGN